MIQELSASDNKLLLHTETEDGTVVPLWEDAEPSDISTMQEVMDHISASLPNDVHLVFRRVPITAEKSLDSSDICDLINAVLHSYNNRMPIIVNCQLGRGRTTLVSVLILLIKHWMGDAPLSTQTQDKQPLTYHVINSLLRVVPYGQETKRIAVSYTHLTLPTICSV